MHCASAVLVIGSHACSALNHWYLLLQGHALFARQAGSVLPCPVLDIPEGFNALMAVAYSIVPAAGQTAQAAIAAQFGSAFGELWSLQPRMLMEQPLCIGSNHVA